MAAAARLHGHCPTGKYTYADEPSAHVSLARLQNLRSSQQLSGGASMRREVRAYACLSCPGWHLTSLAFYAGHAARRRGRGRR